MCRRATLGQPWKANHETASKNILKTPSITKPSKPTDQSDQAFYPIHTLPSPHFRLGASAHRDPESPCPSSPATSALATAQRRWAMLRSPLVCANHGSSWGPRPQVPPISDQSQNRDVFAKEFHSFVPVSSACLTDLIRVWQNPIGQCGRSISGLEHGNSSELISYVAGQACWILLTRVAAINRIQIASAA